MKGFKDSTKTMKGHGFPPARRLVHKAIGGTMNNTGVGPAGAVPPASVAGGVPPGFNPGAANFNNPPMQPGSPPPMQPGGGLQQYINRGPTSSGPMPAQSPMPGMPGFTMPPGGGAPGQPAQPPSMPPPGAMAPPHPPTPLPPAGPGSAGGYNPAMPPAAMQGPGPAQRPPMPPTAALPPTAGGQMMRRGPMYGQNRPMMRATGGSIPSIPAGLSGPPPMSGGSLIRGGLSAPTLQNGPMAAPMGGMSRMGAPRPILPRPHVMPNTKMLQSMPMKALAKGGTVVDQKNSLPPEGPYGNRNTGNTLRQPNGYSQLEAETGFKKPLRPGYAKGGMHVNVKKGALHKRMGVEKGKPLSTSSISKDLTKAKAKGNVHEEKQDVFALNARKWNKARGGGVSEDSTMETVAKKAVSRHVATPKPSGHGIKNGAPPFSKKPLCGGGRW